LIKQKSFKSLSFKCLATTLVAACRWLSKKCQAIISSLFVVVKTGRTVQFLEMQIGAAVICRRRGFSSWVSVTHSPTHPTTRTSRQTHPNVGAAVLHIRRR